MARLFFALWPDAEAARSLASLALRLAGRSGGKPVPEEKIHMTLSFLGEVTVERMGAAFDAAARMRPGALDLALDEIGSFRRARVAWAGVAEPARELLALQEKLETRLRDRGFELEERPFTPHATLVRRIERPIARAPLAAIGWRASAFTLVRSETGTGRYAILESWPLRA